MLDSLPVCIYPDIDDNLEELFANFNKLASYFVSKSERKIDIVRVNAMFMDIIFRYLSYCEDKVISSTSRSANLIVQHTHEYIRKNYSSDCSLQKLSEAVNVSPNHLQSVFTKSVGITPSKYVAITRVEKAKKLLMAGERSLLEIALETGFCSQSHFTKVFKEQIGKTPSVYQKELLERY